MTKYSRVELHIIISEGERRGGREGGEIERGEVEPWAVLLVFASGGYCVGERELLISLPPSL